MNVLIKCWITTFHQQHNVNTLALSYIAAPTNKDGSISHTAASSAHVYTAQLSIRDHSKGYFCAPNIKPLLLSVSQRWECLCKVQLQRVQVFTHERWERHGLTVAPLQVKGTAWPWHPYKWKERLDCGTPTSERNGLTVAPLHVKGMALSVTRLHVKGMAWVWHPYMWKVWLECDTPTCERYGLSVTPLHVKGTAWLWHPYMWKERLKCGTPTCKRNGLTVAPLQVKGTAWLWHPYIITSDKYQITQGKQSNLPCFLPQFHCILTEERFNIQPSVAVGIHHLLFTCAYNKLL